MDTLPGGTWTLGDLTVTRFGYGAMQLAGPGVMGPPADPAAALAVLRAAVELGITHLDTAEAYGPRVTNQLIREALYPYPASLLLATKVGATRDPEALRRAVHENLETLGLERLDLANLRLGDATGPRPGSLAEPLETLASLQRQGLIRDIAPIVCVQNMDNLAHRHDDLIDVLAEQGIAYVPYFPLGGFSPVQFSVLSAVAARRGATPKAVALAWLLRRSPNILLIPGTSSVAHLRENAAGVGRLLDPEAGPSALTADDFGELAKTH